MIKNYLELNETEMQKVYGFMNKNNDYKQSIEEMDKLFRDEVYDFGRGIIFSFNEVNIVGKVSIILKECSEKGIAYIINLDVIEDDHINKKVVLSEIIDKAVSIAKNYGALNIYMGVRDKKIIETLNCLKIYKQYSAVKMVLKDREIKHSPLELIPMNNNNKKEYLKLYNDAFKKTPHGETLREHDVEEYINEIDEEHYYFIVSIDNKNIGFLQINIEEDSGEFDIGLIEAERGKGYGKRLLETAINFLNSKNVQEICLIVITKNTLAYNIYKKRGFEEKQLISDWFIIDEG